MENNIEMKSIEYTINGVKIFFPFKAYPSQITMMDKIIKGIEKSQNCILESPTGSGKSLALLCSTLAWQTAQYDKLNGMQATEDLEKNYSYNNEQLDDNSLLNSSTSSLLSNVNLSDDFEDFKSPKKKLKLSDPEKNIEKDNLSMDNVKDNSENCHFVDSVTKKIKVPRIFYGTRTHRQITQIVRELKRTSYKDIQMSILSSREQSCINPSIQNSKNKNEECRNLIDANGPGCKFFDKYRRTFQPNNIDLSSIWDIEDLLTYAKQHKACAYYGAKMLAETSQLILCPYNYLIDPHIRKSMEISLDNDILILDEAHNIETYSRDAASVSLTLDSVVEAMDDLHKFAKMHWKLKDDFDKLLKMCEGIEDLINRNIVHLEKLSSFDGTDYVWKKEDMMAQLSTSPLTYANIIACKKIFARVEMSLAELVQRNSTKPLLKIPSRVSNLFESVFLLSRFMLKPGDEQVNDYRMVLSKSMVVQNINLANKWLAKKKKETVYTYQLNFWCMNSAIAFKDMCNNARCVVLTSGTLCPIKSFQSELDLPFQIQFEANHIITNQQAWVSCISKGPQGESLDGSFRNSETMLYQDAIGSSIYRVAQVVPHGLLVFFTSYKSLNKMHDRWQTTGLLDQLNEEKKVFTEPRSGDKQSFQQIMDSFFAESDQGAILLAVCRGKISEGLDFADNSARAVIVIGIPYANAMMTEVNLKKEYNNENVNRGLMSGWGWYEVDAFRALNQALGRCIRHRNDWGAIILLEERLSQNRNVSNISKWVRTKLQHRVDFEETIVSLRQFILHNQSFFNQQLSKPDSTTEQPLSSIIPLNDQPSSIPV